VSEQEVWQGQNRKGMVESEEDVDFEVTGKVTVGSNGSSKLVFLFKGCFSSESFFAGDRVGTINDHQVLLLCSNEVTRELVRYGD